MSINRLLFCFLIVFSVFVNGLETHPQSLIVDVAGYADGQHNQNDPSSANDGNSFDSCCSFLHDLQWLFESAVVTATFIDKVFVSRLSLHGFSIRAPPLVV